MVWVFFAMGTVLGAAVTLVTVAITSTEVRRWLTRRERHAMELQRLGRLALVAESNGWITDGRRL